MPTPWHPWRHVRKVRGDYYKVALSLMVDMAEQWTTARYTKVDLVAQEPEVQSVQATLRKFLKAHAFVPSEPTRKGWALNAQQGDDAARAFRSNYLHLSVNPDATGMGPRYKTSNTLERHHEPG